MHKVEIYENGVLVTTFFVAPLERDKFEATIRLMINHANLSSKKNYQYAISKELYDPKNYEYVPF